MPKQRIGNVLVNGSTRQIRTQGDPLNRVVIKVDGVTVYDKWNIVQKKVFNFDLIPGKPASLRWSKIANQIEYEVTVDDQTTRLASVPETAAEVRDQKKLERKIATAACFGGAALSFWMNYDSRMKDGSYYPSYLALIPLLVFAGLIGLFYPGGKFEPKSKVWQVVGGVIGLAIMLFGFTWFTHWFLRTFKY